MSGHSKWATTQRRKSVVDAKRGATFTKLGNLITIAARVAGGDVSSNVRLRLAIEKAKEANMPKDKIERAVSRGTGEGADKSQLEEVLYEALGPGKSALLIEVVTDNKNRAVSEIKNLLNKNGGQMASGNSLLWLFERWGEILLETEGAIKNNPDEAELTLIDAGAEEIIKGDDQWRVYLAPEKLHQSEKIIADSGFGIKSSGLRYLAKEEIAISEPAKQEQLAQLTEVLENLDEVNNVYSNANC